MQTQTIALAHDPVAEHRRRGMFFLGLACGAVAFAMTIQSGANFNFLKQQMGLSGSQQGVLEAVRESCGITALGLLALLAGLAESVVGALVLVAVAVGLAGYSLGPSHGFLWVIGMSLVWSQGLHIWMPLPNSMTLAMAEPGRAGARLGQLGAASAAGAAAGLAGSLALVHPDLLPALGLRVPMHWLYVLAGAVVLLASAACLGIPRQIRTERQRLVLRRKYGLYYALCLLEGWRKQIFIAFSGWLLVERHGLPLHQMLMLWAPVQFAGYFISRPVGRLIDRVGERAVLLAYYGCMVVVFAGYALIDNVYVLCALFVLDGTFFILAMAQTTYVNRIAPKDEHTATLSAGIAFNHVASVAMPLVGGWLWMLGYQWTFAVGAVAAAASLPIVMRMPRRPAAPAAAA